MKAFRFNTLVLAVAATFTLAACSSNSSSVSGGVKTSSVQNNLTSNANSGSTAAKPVASNTNSGSSTEKPTASNSNPSNTTEKPVASNTNSGSTAEKPTASNTNPSNTAEKPVASNPNPSNTTEKPVASNTNPSSTAEKPVASNPNPNNTTEKPVASNPNPSNTTEKPTASKDDKPTADLRPEIAKGFGGESGVMRVPSSFVNENYEMVPRFAADVVSIKQDGSLQYQKIDDDKRGVGSKSFTLNNTRINLLNNSYENQFTENGIALRQMKASDFDAVDDNGKVTGDATNSLHASKPSWVGSVAKGTINHWGEESNDTGSFRNLRYGVYNDAEGNSHLFVFGLPATLNRSSGTIEYAGSAIVGKDGQYEGLGNAMSATANFDTKKVDVSIKRSAGDLRFGGDIKGNSFEGTQNNVYTKGGFYGGNINATSLNSNLGGMFTVIDGAEKGVNGVYGGAQVK